MKTRTVVVIALAILAALAGCTGRTVVGSRGDAGPRLDAAAGDGGSLDAGEPSDSSSPTDAPVAVDAPRADAGVRRCAGPADCNDGDPCTADACFEGTCASAPADVDADGHAPVGCGAGDDCDDRVPSIHPGATEVCDGLDNDCSGEVDDGFECALGSTGDACTTTCGTPGTAGCNTACRRAPCYAAMDVCGNACDDDGDGLVDDGCGGAPPNDTCSTGIDITAGGSFSGTTCGADDTLQLGVPVPPGCDTPVSPGTPDVFYLVRTRPTGSNYRLTITPGFAIQFVPSICSGNGGCGPYRSSMDFTISGGGGTTWYFAIERSGGGCGDFTLNVSGS